jgi:pimeloyl-ACP methyl ester carboxylesterase
VRTSWARGGFVAGLLLLDGLPAKSQALQFTEREVTFRNGSVELRGTLMVPAVEGRHPAVVFLHGSGPATRAGARPYAEEFARLGVASLFFDKRGSGESGGSWTTSSLDDLARDALAAVAHLKNEAGIDPERIGFWGVSQAAWVATLAASRSQDIAFIILISGGGATPRESEIFSYQQAFERAGLSEAERTEAFSVLDDYFRYLTTGEGRSALLARLESARESRWYPLARLDRILPSEQNRSNWSWVATWDPAPHIENLKQPILLMFGDSDTDQPTATAVARWREGLAKAGNDKVTLVVFPGAGHGIPIRTGTAGGDHTGGGRAPFADGYAEVMLGWLWRHVVNARGG